MPHQRERNAIQSSIAREEEDDERCCRSSQRRHRFAIKLAFDGTTYCGFQSQPHGNTIQDQIEKRLHGLLVYQRRARYGRSSGDCGIRIEAWGRTDTGVHALGAVITVDLFHDEVCKFATSMRSKEKKLMMISKKEEISLQTYEEVEDESKTVLRAAQFLQSVLREFACDATTGNNDASGNNTIKSNIPGGFETRYGSITARSVIPVPLDFNPRYSAKWKRYVYYVCSGSGGSLPFAWSRHSWQVNKVLNYNAMINAAAIISNCEHNFEWLCVVQRGELRDTRRTVNLSVERIEYQPMINSNITNNSIHDDDGQQQQQPYFLRRFGDSSNNDVNAIYKISCTCDFFLYKMMRRIVGVLIAVGGSDATLDDLRSCLDEFDNCYHTTQPHDAKTRSKPKVPSKLLNTAPAKGLCLDHIEYDIEI
jgi:tRNA U38,U39,U40 pseudouridine synthase TruA